MESSEKSTDQKEMVYNKQRIFFVQREHFCTQPVNRSWKQVPQKVSSRHNQVDARSLFQRKSIKSYSVSGSRATAEEKPSKAPNLQELTL